MLSPEGALAYGILALLEGLLVLLPRPDATSWTWLTPSPRWALVLPGSLLVGTFGVLAVPASATALVLCGLVATPVLAILAIVLVARGRRLGWFAALPALATGTLLLGGWPGGLATTALTALGTLALGAVLVRMTPLRWLGAGIGAMVVIDVTLLATGVGQPAAEILKSARTESRLPEFHQAALGPITKDYPDLVLAAVLGNALSRSRLQRPAAVLVTVFAAANGLLFAVADMIPATLPIGVAAVVVALLHRAGYGVSRPLPLPSLRLHRLRLPGPAQ